MSAVIELKKIVQGGAFLIEERTPEEIFTPEDFTEEHRMIAETTRQFVDNEVTPHVDKLPGCFCNHPVLFGEIFRRKDLLGRALFD